MSRYDGTDLTGDHGPNAPEAVPAHGIGRSSASNTTFSQRDTHIPPTAPRAFQQDKGKGKQRAVPELEAPSFDYGNRSRQESEWDPIRTYRPQTALAFSSIGPEDVKRARPRAASSPADVQFERQTRAVAFSSLGLDLRFRDLDVQGIDSQSVTDNSGKQAPRIAPEHEGYRVHPFRRVAQWLKETIGKDTTN